MTKMVEEAALTDDDSCPLAFNEKEITFQGPFSKTSMSAITVKNCGKKLLCITVKAKNDLLIRSEPPSFFLKPKQEYTVVLKHAAFRIRKSKDPAHQVNFHYISVDEDWHHRVETGDIAAAREYVEFAEHFLRIFDTVRIQTNLEATEEDAAKLLTKKTRVTAATQTVSVSTRVLHRSF